MDIFASSELVGESLILLLYQLVQEDDDFLLLLGQFADFLLIVLVGVVHGQVPLVHVSEHEAVFLVVDAGLLPPHLSRGFVEIVHVFGVVSLEKLGRLLLEK